VTRISFTASQYSLTQSWTPDDKEKLIPQAHLKKIIDDTERRLSILFDSLNNDAVPKDALGKTGEIARGALHSHPHDYSAFAYDQNCMKRVTDKQLSMPETSIPPWRCMCS
jgi:hypothetical protein